MKYNPNFHHRRLIRLKGYDYSQAGLYFITLLVKHREHLFGRIKNGIMCLNEYGAIAYNEWLRTPTLRPNVSLGELVVMPNHLHGIIVINHRFDEHVLETPAHEAVRASTILEPLAATPSNPLRRSPSQTYYIANYIINNPICWQEDMFYEAEKP